MIKEPIMKKNILLTIALVGLSASVVMNASDKFKDQKNPEDCYNAFMNFIEDLNLHEGGDKYLQKEQKVIESCPLNERFRHSSKSYLKYLRWHVKMDENNFSNGIIYGKRPSEEFRADLKMILVTKAITEEEHCAYHQNPIHSEPFLKGEHFVNFFKRKAAALRKKNEKDFNQHKKDAGDDLRTLMDLVRR